MTAAKSSAKRILFLSSLLNTVKRRMDMREADRWVGEQR
jgi:hypothetical protein